MERLERSSRRTFLGLLGGALAGLAVPPGSITSLRRTSSPVPLALFFDEAARALLAERFASSRFASLRDELVAIDRASLERFLTEEVRTNDHLYDLQRLQTVAPRLAFLYAMTGDVEAARLARDAVRTILRFPKWDYFLDGSGAVLGIQRASGAVVAVACAADWLGSTIDADERAAWIQAMGERGCEACFRSIRDMRYPDAADGWRIDPASTYFDHRPGDRAMELSNWPVILDRTNLKAVPAAALAIGAVAHERQVGADAASTRWLEQAVYSLRTFQHLYAPDGSYDEGISYANYTSQHLAQATEVLRRHTGTDLYDLINWPGFIDYACGLSMPTADDPYAVVNFGDAGTGLRSDVAYWIAARSGDARAQWFAEARSRAHTEWSLIWFDDDRAAAPPVPGPSVWRSDLDWIVARTGHDAEDMVVAMRSGGPANHEHADRNSLIVKAFGEVLVADPYRPPYGQSDPAWLLRTTAGHSALLIDGQGHQYHDGSEGTNASDAAARIVRLRERAGYALWTSDATPAYRLVHPHVRSVTRTVLVLYDLPAIVLVDKVATDGTPVRLQARFFGDNRNETCTIAAHGASFSLSRPRAELTAHAFGSVGIEAVAGQLPIPAERAVQHPFAEIATASPAADPLLATVLAPRPAAAAPLVVEHAGAGTEWTLTLRHGSAATALLLHDTGSIPEMIIQGS